MSVLHISEPYEARLLETPFHARTSAACQSRDWLPWAGYATPNSYTSVTREYFAIRNAAAVIDVSPMVKYAISGPDGLAFLNRLLTRDITRLAPGRVAYALWCDDAGKVIDDGTLFHLGDGNYRLLSQERHLPWLLDTAFGMEVSIKDVSADIAGLAIQGPTSAALLRALGLSGIDTLKPFGMNRFNLGDLSLEVSRTGFTGDLGYEIWVASESALTLWDRLMEAGQTYGLTPAGSRALDMARIEAGFIQANVDFLAGGEPTRPGRLSTPYELDFGWLVDLKKGHFIGRRALVAAHATGPRRVLVGLDIAGNKPANDAFIYRGRRRQVGTVTSTLWSPTVKRNIALAWIDAPHHLAEDGLWAEIYVRRELKWDRIAAPARIVDRRFFDPARRRATPPGDR